MKINGLKKLTTDVLIIGGGTAGCYAALTIKEQSDTASIIIAEKANIKRSGCLAAGVNAINAYIVEGRKPEDYVDYAKKDADDIVREDARNRTVAMYAPSKTFNLAGLVGSYHIIYNTWLRERVLKESSLSHYNAMNVLSMHALVGAYKPEGYEWLDELRQVLTGNVEFACRYIQDHFEGIEVSKPEGTYMLFLDCTKWCEKHGKTIDELQRAGVEVGVIWQDGRPFHGPCHIRMNLALPFSRVQEAFERLDRYVFHAN